MSDSTHIHSETHLKVLRLLQAHPSLSQRGLADQLGISLGKANFCLNALIDRGLLTAQRFGNSNNKLAYAYLLTPAGLVEKTALTASFLKRKMIEYEALKAEIDQLSAQVKSDESAPQL